jgi:opacity protein-like surface antigen
MIAHATRITLALVFGLLLTAAPALAADVDGKWAGTISTPGGDFPVTFEFKADGAKLVGTTMSPDGMAVDIKDGKLEGDKITFLVSFDFGGMALDIAYSGVVAPSEMKMTADVLGMTMDFVVKKEK